jgi:hypothetical protein
MHRGYRQRGGACRRRSRPGQADRSHGQPPRHRASATALEPLRRTPATQDLRGRPGPRLALARAPGGNGDAGAAAARCSLISGAPPSREKGASVTGPPSCTISPQPSARAHLARDMGMSPGIRYSPGFIVPRSPGHSLVKTSFAIDQPPILKRLAKLANRMLTRITG